VAWASDSTRLAFTESLVHGDEPDLWVFDASAGAATNLTVDGVDRLLFEDDGAVGDLAPAWSPDGTELAFSRSVREETALYRVSVAGRGGRTHRVRRPR
jgi:Tol biopolymer transport system component